MTRDGAVMGTPNAMPPERFEGRRNETRSDLRAVAAIAYHALRGQPPHGWDVVHMLVADDEPLTMPPDPTGHVRAWLVHDLAHHPEGRIRDATTMRDALVIPVASPRMVPA